MPQTYDDQIVRWHNECELTARAVHVIRILWYWKRAGTVDPEKRAVNGTLVGFPCGCQCVDEFCIPFLKKPLAVTHAVMKVEAPEPVPVAARHKSIPLADKHSAQLRYLQHISS